MLNAPHLAPLGIGRSPERKPLEPAYPKVPPFVANPVRAPERKSAGGMSTLDFGCEFKLVDGADDKIGRIEGYASVFGVMDRGGDIVLPGAFKKSLTDWKRRKQSVPMLWQHDAGTPIGVWTDLEEDDRGLKVGGDLIMDAPQASVVRALIKGGAVGGLSIGYLTRDSDIDRATGARHLKQVDLWEISPVTFPMLPEARIAGVKGSFDPNTLERTLRDEAGLSSREAKAAISVFRQHLRDGGKTEDDDARDGKADVLMSLRRALAAFGD